MRKFKWLPMMVALLFAVSVFTFTGCNKKDDKADQDQNAVVNNEKDQKKEEEKSDNKDTSEKTSKESTSESTTSEAEKPTESEDTTKPSEAETKEYKRVVASTVAIAEILDMLEFDGVVAVPSSHYPLPERYKECTEIGSPMKPDVEKVLSTEPDLFISVASLEEANKPTYDSHNVESLFLENDSFDDLMDSIILLGEKLNKVEKAEAFVKENRELVARIVEDHKDKEEKSVLFLFGTPQSIMIGTKDSYVGSLLEKINVKNIADDYPDITASYAPLNVEEIINADPDMILRMTHASPEQAQAMFEKEFSGSDIWKNMRAVKEGKVYDLDLMTFGVSGNIRIKDAFEQLEQIIFAD